MTNNSALLRFLFAALLACMLVACGATPNDGSSLEDDAGNPNQDVVTAPADRPVPQPDVPLIADAGTNNPDAGNVDNDVPTEDNSPVEEMSPKSPQMAQICARLNNFGWHVTGTTRDGFINCVLNELTLGSDMRTDLVARYENGICDPTTLECVLPTGGAADGCTFTGLSPDMTSFHSMCHGIDRVVQMGVSRR